MGDADRIRPEGEPVISVADEGEFGLIARITARLTSDPGVRLGPGDDAAVVRASDGRVVATVDLMVEGRHFRADWSTAYDVGRKAAAASLADIVAMGARPTATLVGLACPPTLAAEWVDALADGLRDECTEVGASVVGGDVSAADRTVVAVTALGDLRGAAPVTRAGARPGDLVVLVGRLGYAAGGLALLEAGDTTHPLADAHRRPEVSYAAGWDLAAAGATAMIDVSDGLVADLGHVARASGVHIELTAASLPLTTELREAGEQLGVDPLDWVMTGGDDHAFVATVAPELGTGRVVIGRVGVGEPRVEVLDRTARGSGGHEHFRG